MTITRSTTPGLEFDEAAHIYRYFGHVVPSVTEVLGDNGFIETDYYTEEGRIRGTRVHLLCQFLDEGRYNPAEARRFELEGYVESWRVTKRRLGFTMLDVERRLAHPQYRFGGSPDRLASTGRHKWVLDLKTGARAKWHGFQTGGYEELYLANGEEGPLRRAAVLLKADGALGELVPHEDMHDRHHFLSFVDTTHQRRLHGITDRNAPRR